MKKIENEINYFVQANNIQPADAILVKKAPWKLLNHYIIYLGMNNGDHVFMANTLSGVRVFGYFELIDELKTFIPQKIEKFTGNIKERREAVKRALIRIDENSYNLILNNCEHFKNWVQKGEHTSKQVKVAGISTIAAGGAMATSKNKTVKYTGIGLMILGGLAWAFGDSQKNVQDQ